MKPKILFLAVCLLGFAVAQANVGPDPDPSPCKDKNKKNEINGIITQSDSKKPIRDVSVTAYSVSKKEKTVQSDDSGNFAFDELRPGTYRFVFEKAGFKRVTKDKVVVKTDEGFQMNIEMIENKDFELMPSPFHFSDF